MPVGGGTYIYRIFTELLLERMLSHPFCFRTPRPHHDPTFGHTAPTPCLPLQGYGCELVAYGHDDLMRHIAAAGGGGAVTVVVVEGEMDKLALNTVGYWNVVSVPNGK